MYTHCPHCDTYFRITSVQLKSADGNVRCGRCFGTFNALHQLVDEPPAGAFHTATVTHDEAQKNSRSDTRSTSDNIQKAIETRASIKRERSQQVIEELQDRGTASGSGKRWLLGLLSISLAALLLMQYGYFNLKQLAQHTQFRPALALLCSLADCAVPLLAAPQQIKLLQRDIRAHQSNPGILVVKAEILNQAGFTQPFPLMQLSMQDITGHTITGRRFLPREYLVDKSLNLENGIAPNQSHQILLELADPGDEAVGFKFEFL